MTALTLTKSYGDAELLFKSDIDDMWTELEAFTNGNINDDNINVGWASFSQIELEEEDDFYLGDGIIIRFSDDTMYFLFDETAHEVHIKVDGDTKATVDTSGNFSAAVDIFVEDNTDYSIGMLMNYSKPVLIYTDSTTVSMQQNTTTASRSLLIFPVGPVNVTEDITLTHQFRQLKLSATANGYLSSHVGAADSGMKVGLSLTANTWYFVYAVIVQGGADVGNFVMVVDDTTPMPDNWSDLDTAYGAGCWIYLGPLRYGHGEAATTTLVPFIMDHQGWINFAGGAETDNFFGIRLASTIISTTSYDTVWEAQTGNDGESIPENMSCAKVTYRPVDADDNQMTGQFVLTNSDDDVIQVLPAFSVLLDQGEAHGFEVKVPAGIGAKLKARIGA